MNIFKGRVNRSTYLLANLVSVLLSLVLRHPKIEPLLEHNSTTAVLALLALSPLIIWEVAVIIRRLHDSNLNGWWALLMILPGFTIFLLLMPGNKGENKYGKPPTDVLDLGSLLYDKQNQ
jgi:uncharacterized membrane protein YhaH (DUF805 family)